MKPWILLALCGLLAACSPSKMLEKIANEEKLKIARDYIERLKTGDLQNLATELDPSLRNGKELDQLKAMRAMLPAGPPASMELVGYHWRKTLSGEATYSVSYQLRHGEKWFICLLAWRERDGEADRITSFRVVPLDESLQETHAFSLWDTDLVRALFLAAAVAIPVFILITVVFCIRTKIPKHKWLWIIFILVGFTQVSINWTTGVIGMKPIAFQLLGASAMAQPFMAWMISISFPVGAILFWFKRPAWLAAAAVTPPVEPPALTTQS